MKKVFYLFCVIAFMSVSSLAFSADKVIVFAASSATNVMNEVLNLYNKNGGNAIGSYDGSGNLARQIKAGAPAAIFISADQKWMNELEKENLIEKDSRIDILGNSVVLIASADSTFESVDLSSKPELAKMLGDGKFAIGNPDSVPNGAYAKEGLINLGLWDGIKDRLAMAQNVRVALSYVSMGETPLGTVFGTDAVADKKVKVLAVFPKGSHTDVNYPAAIVKGKATDEVKKLYEFLQSPEAKAVYKKHGFSVN